MKQKGSGEGWGINSSFKQYLLKKRACWRFALNILMCYGVVLCQQKQSASSRLFTQPQQSWKANSSQERVQHKHWLEHTRSPLPWHCHCLSQEQKHREQSQHCTIPAHNSCPASCSCQVRGQVKDWSIPHWELSLRYGKKVHKDPFNTNSGVTSPANPVCALALVEVPLEIFRKMGFGKEIPQPAT